MDVAVGEPMLSSAATGSGAEWFEHCSLRTLGQDLFMPTAPAYAAVVMLLRLFCSSSNTTFLPSLPFAGQVFPRNARLAFFPIF
eukprot:scaffold275569_cov18-Tisochrysis_lutea.AAC.2